MLSINTKVERIQMSARQQSADKLPRYDHFKDGLPPLAAIYETEATKRRLCRKNHPFLSNLARAQFAAVSTDSESASSLSLPPSPLSLSEHASVGREREREPNLDCRRYLLNHSLSF